MLESHCSTAKMSPLNFVLAALIFVAVSIAAPTPADHENLGHPEQKKTDSLLSRFVSRQQQLPRNITAIQEAILNEIRNGDRPRGCTANICFALQSSASISTEDFYSQLDFVAIFAGTISATIRRTAGLSAVQYGRTASGIAKLSYNPDYFFDELNAVRRTNQTATFPSAGLRYCVRSLRGKRGHANIIILLGNGRNDGGRWMPRWAVRRFRGQVMAAGVGKFDRNALARITRSRKRVFASYDTSAVIESIFDFTNRICGPR